MQSPPAASPSTSTPEAPRRSARLRARSAERFPQLVELYDNTASLQDRTVGTGVLKPELARALRRRRLGRPRLRPRFRRAARPSLSALRRVSPSRFRLRASGDVNARIWVRIDEVGESLA